MGKHKKGDKTGSGAQVAGTGMASVDEGTASGGGGGGGASSVGGSASLPQGINIGIDDEARAAIAGGLSKLLADTYTLYLTTHNFHWNVTGPMFNTLHVMFMEQYTELWNAVDPIAERIRSLGHPAPGSYAQFGQLASISDVPATPPKALEMVRILKEGHEAVARTARSVFPQADKAGDEPTADLLTQRLTVHEQTAWMLRSLLEE
jgi:starvation-inducible DNA-binding protein